MDDNDDRKAKENDKIYKIIFENKNTRANIRMGINLGIILIIALIVVGVFFNFIIKYNKGGEILALEAINEIKKAEDKAEELIQEATAKAKEILKVANIQAEDEYNKIVESANLKKSETIKKAEDDGNSEAAPILSKG